METCIDGSIVPDSLEELLNSIPWDEQDYHDILHGSQSSHHHAQGSTAPGTHQPLDLGSYVVDCSMSI